MGGEESAKEESVKARYWLDWKGRHGCLHAFQCQISVTHTSALLSLKISTPGGRCFRTPNMRSRARKGTKKNGMFCTIFEVEVEHCPAATQSAEPRRDQRPAQSSGSPAPSSPVQGRSEGGAGRGQPKPVLLPDWETQLLGSQRFLKNGSEEAASAPAAFSVACHILATPHHRPLPPDTDPARRGGARVGKQSRGGVGGAGVRRGAEPWGRGRGGRRKAAGRAAASRLLRSQSEWDATFQTSLAPAKGRSSPNQTLTAIWLTDTKHRVWWKCKYQKRVKILT